MPISLLVVDELLIVRESFVALIESNFEAAVVHGATNGEDAIDKCRTLRYSIVLINNHLAKSHDVDVISDILSVQPSAKILVFSEFIDLSVICSVIRSGASGLISKFSTRDDLVAAIKSTLNDRRYLCPISLEALASYISNGSDLHLKPTDLLSNREFSIAQMICKGMKSKDIACECGISVATVNRHRNNILRKLHINSSRKLRVIMDRSKNKSNLASA